MRRSLVVAMSVVAAWGLSGCATQGGSAARTDAGDVSMATLAAAVADLQQAQQAPATKPAAGVATANLQRLVLEIVVAAQAEQLGATVTNSQVRRSVATLAAQNGGQAALEQLALQGAVGPAAIDDVVRTNLLVSAIGAKLAAKGSESEQLSAAQVALVQFSPTLHVSVAPRFGRWEDASLSIVSGSGTSTQQSSTAQLQE